MHKKTSERVNFRLISKKQKLSYRKILEIWSGNEQRSFKFETTKKVGSSGHGGQSTQTRRYHSLKRAERESKQGFIHRLITVMFSASPTLPLSVYLVSEFFSGPSQLSLFSAYCCLSRSVHCAPDENDRPSEQTRTS